jgi:DNA-binding PadR family transcriptional regulator
MDDLHAGRSEETAVNLPDLSHLQFVVIGALLSEERTGREIRALLKRYRVRQSGPAFYQMMARLEKAGLIEGWYEQEVVDGQIIKERCYGMTARGARAWSDCRAFYEQAIGELGDGEGLAHA